MYSVEDYWGIRFDKEPTLPYDWDMPVGNYIDFLQVLKFIQKILIHPNRLHHHQNIPKLVAGIFRQVL